jgi:hypothetical protein
MALFNDEAALYLLTRATLLRLRMYPWGQLLTPLAEFAGEILSGLVFGALLTLVTGPGGPAFLAYKVVSMLTRYGPRLGQSVRTLWHALTEIMADMAGIMSGFLENMVPLTISARVMPGWGQTMKPIWVRAVTPKST